MVREVKRRSLRKRPRLELEELEEPSSALTHLAPSLQGTPYPSARLSPPTLPSTPAAAFRKDLHLGSYRKLKSPLLYSRSPGSDNKENSPVSSSPAPIRRRSSFFSPASLRHQLSRAGRVEASPLGPPPAPPLFGQGRHIPLRQGHLWKRCGRLNWRRRYCTLLADRLVYHASLQAYLDNLPGKEIPLETITVKVAGTGEEEAPADAVHVWTIVSLSQQYWTFGCQCPGEREGWVTALQGRVQACLQGHATQQGSDVVERLRGLEGNSHCADCGRPGPEWASINLGVLLCIECCGAHRSLGSHVSKVRSLFLDCVDATSLAHLAAVGNRAAAEVWEVGMEPRERPEEGASRGQREAFVHTKYVVGRWRAGQGGGGEEG